MHLKRRDFINLSATTAATAMISGISSCKSREEKQEKKVLTGDLQLMTNDVVPVTKEEREARIEKAQRLLVEQKIEALLLDAGTSMKYFTGINWWPSERPMVAIIPSKGEVRYVCPGFEE